MLKREQLHDYQNTIVNHMNAHPDSMIWAQMGLGKTVSALTSIVDRMNAGQVKKVLIVAPVRVITAVWAQEAKKWEHTKHLRFSLLHGTPTKRSRAMFADADIHLVNYENLNWLCEQLLHYYIDQGKPLPYQMIVYDEVSKMKNSTSKRVAGGHTDRVDKHGNEVQIKLHGWRKMINQFQYRVGLTGTPASNGYLDLFGQFLAVDGGKRLGEYVTHYKDSYFKSDYMGWGCEVTPVGKQFIEQKISDITIKLDAKDYLDLPDVTYTNMMVDLPPKARKVYDDMEANMFAALDNGEELEVFSKAAVSNKCLQICNGNAYKSPESPEWEKVHDAKLEALEEVIEEAGGSPVLCSYSFKADAERIMKKFKKYKPVNLTAESASKTPKILRDWKEGKIKLLIGHPACLHPSTEVLTERNGWVKIIDVRDSDKVFDGIEFVEHKGCQYSGYKKVIEVFGMKMTPDHKLLINNKWVEAQHVDDSEDTRQKALYKHKITTDGVSKVFKMQNRIRNDQTKRRQKYPHGERILSTLCWRSLSSDDGYANLANLDGFTSKIKRSFRQELRRSRNLNVRKMGEVRELLRRHERRLRRSSHYRTNKCQWRLLQGKLHLGDSFRSTIEQTQQQKGDLSRGGNTFGRIGATIWSKQNETHHEIKQRDDSRRGSRRREKFKLRKESRTKEHCKTGSSEVYDLVDCGPRHRFLIRNTKGEMFISHNSMGHGVDGLQEAGNILVWFGMNWSLELYEQMNARLNRQGQSKPVSIIRILARDTVDLAVADAIERKDDDQTGLKNALERYRRGDTTNDLTVNFF